MLTHALEVLEFDLVRGQLVEACDTSGGASLAGGLLPRFQPEEVAFEIDRTGEAWDILALDPFSLSGVHDVTEACKIAGKGGVLSGEVLYQIGQSLSSSRLARAKLDSKRDRSPKLWVLGQRLPQQETLESKLLSSLDGDGTVRDEASLELASLRRRKAAAAQRIQERVQSYVSGKSRELLSDPIFTQRSGRYVIPLKAENRGKIRGIVHDTSASGATLYVEPEDVVALGNELREAEAAERAEVERILKDLSSRVGKVAPEVVDGLEAAHELDLILAKARLGEAMGGCVPRLVNGNSIKVVEARHPLLDRKAAVPLSVSLGGETDVLLITGPNTGGKTVAIKTVGLCAAMAQSGMMPPAKEVAIGPFTQIWADIGDEQSLQQSLSTFSGHIKNISEALRGTTRGALVLLDEVGAGTDPGEGAALARALLLNFQSRGAKVMASTHYGELKLLAANAPGFMNSSMEFDLKSLRPTYRLMVGVPGSSHAMRIAERHGMPREIIDEALQGFSDEHMDVSRMIERLETAQKQAQRAQSEADRLASRLRQVEQEAEEAVARAEATRRQVRERAGEELAALLREIRLEAADIFEQLKRDPSQKGFDAARQRLRDLQAVGEEMAQVSRPKREPNPSPAAQAPLVRGTAVRVRGYTQTGVIADQPKDGKAMVQIGPLKMKVALRDLTPVAPETAAPSKSRSSGAQLQKAMTASTEIHLRHYRAEDALEILEKFIDDAVLGGLSSVRIVHGKGEGVLRKVTQDYLRGHRHVRSFAGAEPSEGGDGVTVAVLK